MQVDVKDVLQLIRLYRHDLMNDLQLVHGYASMNKPVKSKERLEKLIAKLSEERSLQTLDAPQFVYWLICTKLQKRELEIEFDIDHSNHSLGTYDEQLVKDGKSLLNQIERNLGSLEGLHICLEIKYEEHWNIKYRIKGNTHLDGISIEQQTNLNMEYKDDETSFVFSYK